MSPSSLIISPTSLSQPTLTSSYIFEPDIFSATTTKSVKKVGERHANGILVCESNEEHLYPSGRKRVLTWASDFEDASILGLCHFEVVYHVVSCLVFL